MMLHLFLLLVCGAENTPATGTFVETARWAYSSDTPYTFVSSAVSGNLAVIGAHSYLNYSGSAYVFRTTDGTHTATLTASGGVADNDGFGFAVAIWGSIVAVGAAQSINDGVSSGAVYTFRTTDGGLHFTQTQKLTPDTQEYDNFGTGVAIAGNLLVVSAPTVGEHIGVVYVFRTTDGGLTFEATQTLFQNPEGSYSTGFGWGNAYYNTCMGVAVSGDLVVVSALDGPYVFRTSDGGVSFSQTQQLTCPQFNGAVTMDGSIIVAGSDGEYDEPPKACVFRTIDGGLTFTQTTTLAGDKGSSYFSRALAISGDTVVVNAFEDNGASPVLFTYRTADGGLSFGRTQKITAPGAASTKFFPQAFSGDFFIVGASEDYNAVAYLFAKALSFEGNISSTLDTAVEE